MDNNSTNGDEDPVKYNGTLIETYLTNLNEAEKKNFYRAVGYQAEGEELFKNGLFDDAINKVKLAIEVIPDFPEFHFNLGVIQDVKSENLIKEAIIRKMPYDELAMFASSSLEEALLEFQKAKQFGFRFTPEQEKDFSRTCSDLDQFNPGRPQELGIPLSLNRMSRVSISNTCRTQPHTKMFEAEFIPNDIVLSALVISCVSGSVRQQARVALFSTKDIDLDLCKANGSLYIEFPGYNQSTGENTYDRATVQVQK